MSIRFGALLVAVGLGFAMSAAPLAAAGVPLTLDAVVGPAGTTLLVGAPGCQPSPPGEFEIFVQAVSPDGEVGEGAVAAGSFTAPGQGSVLITAGTPVSRFLVTVSCNGGELTASQFVQFAEPVAAPPAVVAPARFTG